MSIAVVDVLIRPMTVGDVTEAERLSDEAFSPLAEPGMSTNRSTEQQAMWRARAEHLLRTDPAVVARGMEKHVAQNSGMVVRAVSGFGSPGKAATADAHGSPLGPEEVKATKENLGWPLEPLFRIPPEVRERFGTKAITRAALLGHGRLDTVRIYTQPDQDALQRAAQLLEQS